LGKNLIILILLFFSISGLAQQYNFERYSGANGLAQSQVYTMIEDSRGYLWMGTWGGGLSRFDGKDFKNYSVRDGLVNNYIWSIFEDREHNIWIGTKNGVCKFNGRGFKEYKLERVKRLQITAITQDENGVMWFGTSNGIYQIIENKVIHFSKQKNLPLLLVRDLQWDSQNRLWVGGEAGVFRITNKRVKRFYQPGGLINNDVRSILEDNNGKIWVGTYGGGINIIKGDSITNISTDDGLSSDRVNDVFQDTTGLVWIGTQDAGISLWNPKDSSFSYYREPDGLCKNDVRKLLQDRWGNIWIATSGGGVCKFYGQQFIHFDRDDGLAGERVYALCEDEVGRIWFSASDRGISYYDKGNTRHFGGWNGFQNVTVKTILYDGLGKIWIGTQGDGLAVYEKDTFRFVQDENLRGKNIKDLIQDTLGNIWMATADAGIVKINLEMDTLQLQDTVIHFKDSLEVSDTTFESSFEINPSYSFQQYTLLDGLLSTNINCLHLDSLHRIWFATQNERRGEYNIGYIKNDTTITNFTKRDGLPPSNIRVLEEDTYGNLWLGTAEHGISKLSIYEDSLQIKTFGSRSDSLTSDNIYLIKSNGRKLWVGNEKGVDLITLDRAREVAKVKHYGYAEGFKGRETCTNAVTEDGDGNLWFGTMAGLMKYAPSTAQKNKKAPSIQIIDIRLLDTTLIESKYKKWAQKWGGLKNGLVLKYRENDLEFLFKGIDHSNPDKIFYQYQFSGREGWSKLSANNSVSFPRLSSGVYTFRVRACNVDGLCSKTPATANFEITPPIWKTWWFLSLLTLAGLALIAWFYKSKVKQIRRKAAREKERLEMEKNLLGLEQKALQLQMNPHFIFNALNSIQALISQQDNKKARYQLAKFSKLMRSILENSRETLIPLESEIETLENYLNIEKSSKGDAFDFEIEVDDRLDPEEVMIPPMMIQPFVENAIIHGVAHVKEGGEIKIKFELKGVLLECSVEDNGIGRAAASKIKSQVEHQHKSAALKVTQERLDIMNPSNSKSLEIIDIVHPDGVAGGTKVIVRIPLQYA